MEIQQSSHYAAFITALGWKVETIEGAYIYIKPFPLVGGLVKLQRTKKLPSISKLLPKLARYHVRTLAIEPDSSISQATFSAWVKKAQKHIRINTDYYLQTKTIRVDLRPPEQEIFDRFTEAKRRAVRRAEKHGITIMNTNDIDVFIRLKNRSAGLLGFITTHGLDKLWSALPTANKNVLLAKHNNRVVAGIFLIFWKNIAYYWVAGATKEGKKLFAPTLLVWKALKESKKRGCKAFDFVGVWDERLSTKNNEWKGFTKFKEGFGGTPLYYPLVR